MNFEGEVQEKKIGCRKIMQNAFAKGQNDWALLQRLKLTIEPRSLNICDKYEDCLSIVLVLLYLENEVLWTILKM